MFILFIYLSIEKENSSAVSLMLTEIGVYES